jgi:anthranilate synthase component 2
MTGLIRKETDLILLIDNYDSFSYNLYQSIGAVNEDIKVVRNDELSVEQIRALRPTRIVLSPGPGHPRDAGIIESLVTTIGGDIPILGVCLGHQAICEAYGATVSYAKELMHGKPSRITLDTSSPIFANLPHEIQGARYHSLATIENTLPGVLKVTARADDGEIMAVQHIEYPIYGLQFHPESILTPDGEITIRNFIERSKLDENC